jgi:hypothetical protein
VTALPVVFRSNPGKYNFLGTPKLINAYAEQQGNDGKGPLAVLPCPGLVQHASVDDGPGRGLIYLEDIDALYSIHPHSAYRIYENGTTLRIGVVPGTGQVQLSRNQAATPEITVMGDGHQIISSDSVQYVLDPSLPDDPITQDYVSSYNVIGYEDRRFFLSAIDNALSFDALDFDAFDQYAGKLVRVKGDGGQLFGFCSRWFEVYNNSGSDFPFDLIATRQRGLLAANAVVASDNTLMFPGDDRIVYRLDNYDPRRISTHYIERLLENETNPSGIIGFEWTSGGHKFCNFTGTNFSACYDSATQVWHNRESHNLPYWRARNAVKAWNKTIVQDALTGKIGYLDSDTFTEYGNPMIWGVDSPTLHIFPNGGILDAVHFDLATGYGAVLSSSQGHNPKVMLEVSKDGGNTFSQYRELELGKAGKYQVRVTARRLGRITEKGAVFRLRISDPVVRALVNTDVEARPLKR